MRVPATVELSAGDVPHTADIVVVGAGLAGLASAFYASRAGLGRVVLVEAGDRVAGLTSHAAAAGFRLEWDAPENIAMVRSSIETFKHFDEVIGIRGYSVGMKLPGYLFLSSPTGQARREANLGSRVSWWRDHGLQDVELLNGDEARRRWPFVNGAVEAAHYRQDEGYLNVADVARGYVLGGQFRTFLNAVADSITITGGRVSGVRLANGASIATGAVVVAAGPFSADLVATTGTSIDIRNRRRHALILNAPPSLVDPSWPVVLDSDLGLYWRPRTEGRTTTGIYIGWERALTWDQQPGPPADPVPADPRYLAAVKEEGHRLNTIWAGLDFGNVIWRTGQYTAPGNDDGRPMIGTHPQVAGLYINTAYEGRGVMASPGGAETLVQIIKGSAADADPFSVDMAKRQAKPDLMVL